LQDQICLHYLVRGISVARVSRRVGRYSVCVNKRADK
jgi:hypothetical protein